MKKQRKVILVGNGAVGSSFAFSLLQNMSSVELVVIDINKEKTMGDVLDLQDVTPMTGSSIVRAGTYEDATDADIAVVTAGVPRQPGETRLDLFKKNTNILKAIVMPIVNSGFDGCFVISSNPVDVLTTITQHLSGFSKEKVIGTGTSLDSARLCVELALKLNVLVSEVKNAYVLGEHGDSLFATFAEVTVLGKKLSEIAALDKKSLQKLEESVRKRGSRIIDLKKATHYGVAVCLMRICKAILTDEEIMLPVSAPLVGQYGQKGIYLGTPAIIGTGGIKQVIEMQLVPAEFQKMKLSADKMREVLVSLE